jgi:hypothetical protein
MDRRIAGLTLTLAMLLIGFGGLHCTARHTVQGDPELEEYAVYSAVITQMYVPTTLIVLRNEVAVVGSDAPFRPVLNQLTSLSRATMKDYDAKNKAPHPLKPLFTLPIPYVLIGQEEIDAVHQDQVAGWKRFSEKYPGAPGIITVSRVGFNAWRTQALLLVAQSCAPMKPTHERCGRGHYVLLVKKNGTWEIEQEQLLYFF